MKQSEILKRDKTILIQNVNNYIMKNEAMKSKIKSSINAELSNSEDTLLANSLYSKCEVLIANIDKLNSQVESERDSALASIDQAIERVLEQERQEELARQKAQEESKESEE